MKVAKITVKSKSKSYPVYFGEDILKSLGKFLKQKLPGVRKIYIIGDKNIPKNLYKKINLSLIKYKVKIYKLRSTESTKSLKVANKLIENLLKDNANRSDCVIAFGGGVIGDLSAFVSNLTKRGLKFINIPTTLLSQVDASIGGKTAVNSAQGKNLIGTFYQPDFVLVDLLALDSLSSRELVCGYGEILKHSLILDKKFFLWLEKNGKKIIDYKDKKILQASIIKSCLIKSKIISKDEKEKNLRMMLNFGHTFAHGFEGAKKFSDKLNHGEAVLLGMMSAAQLSYKKKLLSYKDLSMIKKHYLNLKLPMKISNFFKKKEINKIVSFMSKDKKNYNKKINLILLKKIGQTTKPGSVNINSNDLKRSLIDNFK